MSDAGAPTAVPDPPMSAVVHAAPLLLAVIARAGDGSWVIRMASDVFQDVTGIADPKGAAAGSCFPFSAIDDGTDVLERLEPGESEVLAFTIPTGELGARWRALGPLSYWTMTIHRATPAVGLVFGLDRTLEYRYASLLDDALRAQERAHESLSSTVHELRQPITGIQGFVGLLAMRDDLDDPELLEAVDVISSQARHLNEMLEDLMSTGLSVAGRLRFQVAPVSSDALRQELETIVRVFAKEGAQGAFSVQRKEIVTDLRRVSQLVRGLVHNASKYGGEKIEVRARDDGALVVIEVADDGPGVPQGERQAIFEPFRRGVRAKAAGTGIGLSVARSIAAGLGGTLEYVDGDPGAVFRLTLPGSPDPASMQIVHDATEEREGLYAALITFQSDAARSRLNRIMLDLPVVDAIQQVIQPVMYTVGDAWRRGEISVAQEHHASSLLNSWLVGLLERFPVTIPGPILCACVPGNDHENGIATTTVILKNAGFDARYLGRGLPVEDLIDAVRSTGARAVVVSVALVDHVLGLRRLGRAMAEEGLDDVLLGYGGRVFVEGFPHDDLPGQFLGLDGVQAIPILEELVAR